VSVKWLTDVRVKCKTRFAVGPPAYTTFFFLPTNDQPPACQISCFIAIMSEGDDSATLWKVNRTVHEMVKDRVRLRLSTNGEANFYPLQGFSVADDEISMTLDTFRSTYGSQMGSIECVVIRWMKYPS